MLKKKRINDQEFCQDLFLMNGIAHVFLGSAVVFESFPGDDYLIRGNSEVVTQFDRAKLDASQLRKDQLCL